MRTWLCPFALVIAVSACSDVDRSQRQPSVTMVAVGLGGTVVVQDVEGNWTLASFPTQTTLYRVASVGGRVVVTGEGGAVFRSRDAITYQGVTLPGACTDYNDVVAHDGAFYILGVDGNGDACAHRSSDGATWAELGGPAAFTLENGASLDGKLFVSARRAEDFAVELYQLEGDAFVVVGRGSSDSAHVGSAIATGDRPYTLWGERDVQRIDSTSPWTTTSVGPGPSGPLLFGLAARGTTLVAVGWEPTADQPGVALVREAPDADWRVQSLNPPAASVVDTGDRFVAVGLAGMIAESADGREWRAAPSPTKQNLHALTVVR